MTERVPLLPKDFKKKRLELAAKRRNKTRRDIAKKEDLIHLDHLERDALEPGK